MEASQANTRLQVVEAPKDCGNAPRKMVIRDVLVAIAECDQEALTEFLREDIRWEIVGSERLTGLDQIRDWVLRQRLVAELHISTVITHGTDCGADGWIIYPNGSTTRFSHIVVFAGHSKTAKIKALRSYLIDTSDTLPTT